MKRPFHIVQIITVCVAINIITPDVQNVHRLRSHMPTPAVQDDFLPFHILQGSVATRFRRGGHRHICSRSSQTRRHGAF